MSGKRVSFFIDGFNFYHNLVSKPYFKHFRWLNFKALAKMFVSPQNSLIDVFYFTAYPNWNKEKRKRHEVYISALEQQGVKSIFGEFRLTEKRCRKCGNIYTTFEEKETDVNISTQLFEQAYKNTYDIALILTADSDQIPTLKALKRNFCSKQIGVVIPPGGRAELLKKNADFHRKIKPQHLRTSLLPESVTLSNGTTLTCPESWLCPVLTADVFS